MTFDTKMIKKIKNKSLNWAHPAVFTEGQIQRISEWIWRGVSAHMRPLITSTVWLDLQCTSHALVHVQTMSNLRQVSLSCSDVLELWNGWVIIGPLSRNCWPFKGGSSLKMRTRTGSCTFANRKVKACTCLTTRQGLEAQAWAHSRRFLPCVY